MVKKETQNRVRSLVQFGLVLAALLLFNLVANSRFGNWSMYTAWDLTEEKRFTLTDNTRRQLENIKEVVFIRVYLDGSLPVAYKRLQSSTSELLQDFRAINSLVEYEFSDPLQGDPKTVQERQRILAEEEGLLPVPIYEQTANKRDVRNLYPYAMVYYGGRREIVNLLENETPGVPKEVIINKASALLEYKLTAAIQRVVSDKRPLVVFTEGHGELPPIRTADLERNLRTSYEVGRLHLDSMSYIPNEIEVLIVAKPTLPFDAKDAFKMDQYIMNGGKVLWAIDPIAMHLDSLRSRPDFYPAPFDLGALEDLFFRYGFRLNQDLVQDLVNTRIPITVTQVNGQPAIEKFPFPYHVLSLPNGKHPIIKNLDPIDLRFPSSIDLSLETGKDLEKTVLLTASDRARYQRLPSAVDLNMQKFSLELEYFNKPGLVLGALLEGQFNSPFANRLTAENKAVLQDLNRDYLAKSVPTRMIVVSDGDWLANSITTDQQIRPLGFNAFEGYQYDNKTLALNMIEYLRDDAGVITARGKEVKLRLLNKDVALAETAYWRLLNIVLPLVFLAIFGLLFNYLRRRAYT